MAVKLQLRGDTAAAWTAANPILAEREFAIEMDTQRLKVGDGTTAWNSLPYLNSFAKTVQFAVTDEFSNITAGSSKFSFRVPFAMALTEIRASLVIQQTSGAIFTVDVKKSGASMLFPKLTIDNGEKTSLTAATPVGIVSGLIADDEEITVDINQIGSGSAVGLKITMKGV
jgi:hypothetical protein